MTVKNPWVRGDLIRHLGDLAGSWRDPSDLGFDVDIVEDEDDDEDEFTRPSFGSRATMEFKEDPVVLAVRFLFETSRLTVDPEASLGVILENLEELGSIVDVIESMHRAFKAHGMQLESLDLRGSKDWKRVCKNAKYAFNLLAAVDL